MSKDTLLIFTSDNGPVWYEPDVERYAHDSAGGLRGMNQPTSTPLRSSLAMQSGNGVRTIRSGQWKLIEGLGSGGFSEPKRVTAQVGEPGVQLYNLRDDLGESTNLATANPEIVERLQAELREIAQ